ncbi:aconitase X catalytic domain-containing protein [Candidatus Undinarchaeota archaeon]
MHLTKSDENILNGEEGHIKQKALEILVGLGKIFDAEKLIPVRSVQVAGVSYQNIGDAGLQFLEDWAAEAKVVVPTTLNPAGMDLENWEELIEPSFADKQLQVIDAYKRMGIRATCTCTPYYVGNVPNKGDHIAWSESSAVVYANSVLGAYTNREGGPSALAAAIIGKTAAYGYHLEENRLPVIQVSVPEKMFDYSDYSAAGYWIGQNTEGVPLVDFGRAPKNEQLRGFSAGLAASGDKAMFVLGKNNELPEVVMHEEDLINVYSKFMTDEEFEVVYIGCPHLSFPEVAKIARTISNKKLRYPLLLFCSREVYQRAFYKGYLDILKRAGARLVADTCMVVSPMKFKSVMTNSAKAAHYLKNFGVKVELAYTDDCIKYALGGKYGG